MIRGALAFTWYTIAGGGTVGTIAASRPLREHAGGRCVLPRKQSGSSRPGTKRLRVGLGNPSAIQLQAPGVNTSIGA